MCSICRDFKNCKFQFGVESWNPKNRDGLVTVQIPESDLTFLESVRIAEENLKDMGKNKQLSLPSGNKDATKEKRKRRKR